MRTLLHASSCASCLDPKCCMTTVTTGDLHNIVSPLGLHSISGDCTPCWRPMCGVIALSFLLLLEARRCVRSKSLHATHAAGLTGLQTQQLPVTLGTPCLTVPCHAVRREWCMRRTGACLATVLCMVMTQHTLPNREVAKHHEHYHNHNLCTHTSDDHARQHVWLLT